MTGPQTELYSYERPPIREVVMAIEFAPLARWNVSHFGLFKEYVKELYPEFSVHPSFATDPEQFGPPKFGIFKMALREAKPGDVRAWYQTSDKSRLVQIQPDRIITNWRRFDMTTPYPRYDKPGAGRPIREQFWDDWRLFTAFLKSQEIDAPRIVQCEMTYINDIARGEEWADFSDLHRIIAPWSGKFTTNDLPTPESVGMRLAYVLPNRDARLHVQITHAQRQEETKEIIQLRLTVRGVPISVEEPSVDNWFNEARRWIVLGFTDVTSPEAQKRWGREE